MPKSTITSKGQTTIPKVIRLRLGLDSGDTLIWEETDDGIRVSVASRAFARRHCRNRPRLQINAEPGNRAPRDGPSMPVVPYTSRPLRRTLPMPAVPLHTAASELNSPVRRLRCERKGR